MHFIDTNFSVQYSSDLLTRAAYHSQVFVPPFLPLLLWLPLPFLRLVVAAVGVAAIILFEPRIRRLVIGYHVLRIHASARSGSLFLWFVTTLVCHHKRGLHLPVAVVVAVEIRFQQFFFGLLHLEEHFLAEVHVLRALVGMPVTDRACVRMTTIVRQSSMSSSPPTLALSTTRHETDC